MYAIRSYYATELARMPDAIELMSVVEVDSKSKDGVVEFYLFRFKSGSATWVDKGWMSGVSGYFPKKEKPSTESYGYTFSAFQKWDVITSYSIHYTKLYDTYDELNRLTSIQHRSNDILNYANRWSPYSGNKVYPISEITYSTESRISQIVTNTNSLEDNIEFISYSEYDNPFYQINSDLGYPFIKDFLLFGDKLPAEFKKGVLLTSYGQLKVETRITSYNVCYTKLLRCRL